MWLILQAQDPEDWVIATGKSTSVRDFIIMAFNFIGVQIEFKGKGKDEVGYVVSTNNIKYKLEVGKKVVLVDPKYYRPTEVDCLVGDSSKAYKKLGWKPKYDLKSIIKDMMESDLKIMGKEKLNKQ